MAKITRPDINVQGFASSPQSQERTTFGTETESTDLEDFLTPEFLRGWGVLPVGGKPPYQWFNGAVYLISQLQAMHFQQGIPEYAASQEFHKNGFTAKNGVLFRSKTDSNTGNDPEADPTNWQPQTAMVPGTKSVNDIDGNGVLEITPDDGKYITLTDHGAADFEITGFGDQCPVGYSFDLYAPRTIANTGGTPYSLGNYVQFIHSTSGAGLDLTINKRMNEGSGLYTYQKYPNACAAFGDAAALYEQTRWIHEGSGRWRCVKMPDEIYGANTNGEYTLSSSGVFNFFARNIDVNFTAGSVLSVGEFPARTEYPGGGASSSWSTHNFIDNTGKDNAHFLALAGDYGGQNGKWVMVNNSSVSFSYELNLSAIGRWKPNV